MTFVKDKLVEALESYSEVLSNAGCNDMLIQINEESKRFLLKMADEYCDKEYADDLKEKINSGATAVYTYDWMVVGYLKKLVTDGKILYTE